MADAGVLQVRVEDDSVFLSNNLPYVVRDARHSVVARGSAGADQRLPAGLYSVEVITPRGARQTELVQITAGTSSRVLVTDAVAASSRGAQPMVEPVVEPAGAPVAALVETAGCTLDRRDAEGWVFLPVDDLRDVPRAVFDLAGWRWTISLPLNPEGAEPALQQCRVRLEAADAGPRLAVSFGDRRRVYRMLDGLLREDAVASAAELLDQAAELLLSKYSDPVAAALGGLTLHRYGRLRERQSWVENLARDFAWLPDGQILCAALLVRDPDADERGRGLQLLFSATVDRPLFTDGLSLASDLLRRWPGEEFAEKRTERLGRLADYSAHADWDAIALTTRTR